jgi:hypothetical protein
LAGEVAFFRCAPRRISGGLEEAKNIGTFSAEEQPGRSYGIFRGEADANTVIANKRRALLRGNQLSGNVLFTVAEETSEVVGIGFPFPNVGVLFSVTEVADAIRHILKLRAIGARKMHRAAPPHSPGSQARSGRF